MSDLLQRVLSFDATPLIQQGLNSGVLKPSVRYQAYARTADFFPSPIERACACGCQRALTGRQRRWVDPECTRFAIDVLRILKGDADTISYYLAAQHGEGCAHCGVMDEALQVDHILPVHRGGGGRWLDNYQLLCADCHKVKTAKDRAQCAQQQP